MEPTTDSERTATPTENSAATPTQGTVNISPSTTATISGASSRRGSPSKAVAPSATANTTTTNIVNSTSNPPLQVDTVSRSPQRGNGRVIPISPSKLSQILNLPPGSVTLGGSAALSSILQNQTDQTLGSNSGTTASQPILNANATSTTATGTAAYVPAAASPNRTLWTRTSRITTASQNQLQNSVNVAGGAGATYPLASMGPHNAPIATQNQIFPRSLSTTAEAASLLQTPLHPDALRMQTDIWQNLDKEYPPNTSSFEKLRVAELKTLCDELNLSKMGLKNDLKLRILNRISALSASDKKKVMKRIKQLNPQRRNRKIQHYVINGAYNTHAHNNQYPGAVASRPLQSPEVPQYTILENSIKLNYPSSVKYESVRSIMRVKFGGHGVTGIKFQCKVFPEELNLLYAGSYGGSSHRIALRVFKDGGKEDIPLKYCFPPASILLFNGISLNSPYNFTSMQRPIIIGHNIPKQINDIKLVWRGNDPSTYIMVVEIVRTMDTKGIFASIVKNNSVPKEEVIKSRKNY